MKNYTGENTFLCISFILKPPLWHLGSIPASRVRGSGFDLQSGQTKHLKIGIC